MKKTAFFTSFIIFCLGLPGLSFSKKEKESEFTGKTIHIESADGVTITADIYTPENTSQTFILLFHQAFFSRGEYRPIAPQLVKMGYTCMAIDQRSGRKVNGVVNKTHEDAKQKGKPTKYINALPDLEAALQYVKTNYPDQKIIIWGSSYSASLSFVMGQKYKKDIAGIVSFSPGEYFKFDGKMIKEYAKEVECPVWISSAKKEYDSWIEIFEQIPAANKNYFLPETKGIHGSRGLWEKTEGHKQAWESLKTFLKGIK